MLLKFLEKELPNWIRDLAYIAALLETIAVVIIYFSPDLWAKFIELFC